GAAAGALVTGGDRRAGPPGGPGGARRQGRGGQVRDRRPGRRDRIRPCGGGGGQHRRGPVRARRGAAGGRRGAGRGARARARRPHGATAAVPVDDIVNNDLSIRGSFGYTSAAWREVVTLLNAGLLELGFLVTHRFPLTEWREALDTLRGEASPRGKVMLTIGSTE